MGQRRNGVINGGADLKDAIHASEFKHLGDGTGRSADCEVAPTGHTLEESEDGTKAAAVDKVDLSQIEYQRNGARSQM